MAKMPKQSEKSFMAQVVALAKLRGFIVYHTFDSRRSVKGFPDCCFARRSDGRLIFAELKSDHGRLTPEQEMWLAVLRATEAEIYVWRPCDWADVERILL